MDDKLLDTISTILTGAPVKIFDEESYSVLENELWELVHFRRDGDYKGTRIIGSANIALAFNIIRQNIVIDRLHIAESSNSLESCATIFKEALEQLQKQRIIRKKPHRVRQSFKLISNE